MGNIRLYGSTSGYTELAPPAVAPDGVLSLPSGVGTLLTAEGGKVLQVVRATDSTSRSTSSSTYVDASISVTITPQKSDSTILLIWNANLAGPTNQSAYVQITNSSNTAISGAEESRFVASAGGVLITTNTIIAYDSPGTTSATTYKGRFRVFGTATLQNDLNTGQLYAIEVSA